jgi:hypothetical protein
MAGFMQLQVWQEVGLEAIDPEDTSNSYLMPQSYAEHCESIAEPDIDPHAWWAEYTAPGYMDKTDCVYGKTPIEAARECFELYGDWESTEDRSELAAVLWKCRAFMRKVNT